MKTKIIILAIAAIALLAACKHKGYEVGYSSAADSVTSAAPDSTEAKLVKTAGISMKVKNVQQAGDSVSALTQKYGGMVIHRAVNSAIMATHDVSLNDDSIMRTTSFNTTSDITVRVPSVKVEEFMGRAAGFGLYITGSTMDIEDKSLDYLASQLKLKNRREIVAGQKKGKITIKDPAAVLLLHDDMIDNQIENQKIDDAVKYSVVKLNLYQSNTIATEKLANDDPSSYKLPFFSRLSLAIGNGWGLFTEAVIGLANLWVIILVGAGLWLLYKTYKRRYATVAR